MVTAFVADTITSPIIGSTCKTTGPYTPSAIACDRVRCAVFNTSPPYDVFRGLALFRIEHDATRFTADMADALHEPLILCNVNHGFGISGDHTVVRHNHNQCAFGHAAAEKAELSVNTLVRANPFVGIPTVIMPDLIGITQIQVRQSRIFAT